MTWFRSDDGFWRSRKVRKLGRDKVTVPALVACSGLWILAGTWAAASITDTDGFVPWEIVDDWDVKRTLSTRLLVVGLWEEADHDGETGIRFHDWADYNPTALQVLAEREAAAERMRKIRAVRKNNGHRSPERSGEQDANVRDTFDRSSRSPSRPVPEVPDGTSNARPRAQPRPSTTDQRIAQAQALKAHFRDNPPPLQLEGGTL